MAQVKEQKAENKGAFTFIVTVLRSGDSKIDAGQKSFKIVYMISFSSCVLVRQT